MTILLLAMCVVFFAILLWMISRKRPIHAHHGNGLQDPIDSKQDSPGDSLVIGSFNMHRARGADGKKNIERIAQQIKDADLVGLYEVEGPLSWWRKSQSENIAEIINCGWLFVPTQRRWLQHDRGNAIVSRREISDWYIEPLVDSTGRRPRALLESQISWCGIEIRLLVVHMSRHVDQEVQFARIMDRFLACRHAILIGDLNVNREFLPLKNLLDNNRADDAIGKCLTGLDDENRIDWILTRGLQIVDGGVKDEGASDHPYFWVAVGEPDAA
ncbi:MAG: endonuclease/exonuclease/phosphatase family metal-dependent hydrolase [Gammaproteobacteria bacterium]